MMILGSIVITTAQQIVKATELLLLKVICNELLTYSYIVDYL